MIYTAFPSARTSAPQLPSPIGQGDVTSAKTAAERASLSSAVHILSSDEDLEAAIRRVEAFERRNAEQLANRVQRHQAALAGTAHHLDSLTPGPGRT
jgi:hypothetical protein